MKRNKVLTYLLFLLLPLAVGGLAALVTYHGMPVYEQLEKPVFTPPSFLFPIVWNLLYVLMGIGAARVWLSQDPMRGQRLRPFVLQLILNFFLDRLVFWRGTVSAGLLLAPHSSVRHRLDDRRVFQGGPAGRAAANPLSALDRIRRSAELFYFPSQPITACFTPPGRPPAAGPGPGQRPEMPCADAEYGPAGPGNSALNFPQTPQAPPPLSSHSEAADGPR